MVFQRRGVLLEWSKSDTVGSGDSSNPIHYGEKLLLCLDRREVRLKLEEFGVGEVGGNSVSAVLKCLSCRDSDAEIS